MKEYTMIELEYIRSNNHLFNIDSKVFEKYKIHVPECATPKDDLSAGIAMLTSMVSTFTQRKIKKNVAMRWQQIPKENLLL